ncbi:unnamed protein product, partial [Didymodactylos carnosus]
MTVPVHELEPNGKEPRFR